MDEKLIERHVHPVSGVVTTTYLQQDGETRQTITGLEDEPVVVIEPHEPPAEIPEIQPAKKFKHDPSVDATSEKGESFTEKMKKAREAKRAAK